MKKIGFCQYANAPKEEEKRKKQHFLRFFVRNFLKEVSDTFKNFHGRVYITMGECLCARP